MPQPGLTKFCGDRTDDVDAFGQWVSKLEWVAEIHKWSDEERLVQLKLLLSGRADQLYDVLPDKEKATFNDAIEALEKQLLPERREALMSVQLMSRLMPSYRILKVCSEGGMEGKQEWMKL